MTQHIHNQDCFVEGTQVCGFAPAEQASKQVPTINSEEFRKLVFGYAEALFSGSESAQRDTFATLTAHIDAKLAGQPAAPVAKMGLKDEQISYIARQYFSERWAQDYAKSAIYDAFKELDRQPAAPVEATEQAKDTPESMANSNARFAIDGAIQYGRENRNPPPSADHWLAEYWNIGRQLAKLGETGWDNVTPLVTPADAGAGLTDEQLRETDGYKLGWMEGMQEGAELATAGEKTAADVEAEFAGLLPGSYYMDPPDGGSPSVLEQVSRMANDAAQWRAHIATQAPVRCDAKDVEWSHDLQARLIAGSQNVAEADEVRIVMAEAACLLAAITGVPGQVLARLPTPAAPVTASQPAAQVPSAEHEAGFIAGWNEALNTARADVRELQNNLETFGPYGEESARVALDGALDAIDELKGQPAAAHAAKTDEQGEREQIEARAKEIYRTFPFSERYPWVEGGNSIRQDDARDMARAELKAAAHAAHDQKGSGRG